MTYKILVRVHFRLVLFILSFSFFVSARADSDESYWMSVLKKVNTLQHDSARNAKFLNEGNQLRAEVIQRLKDKPSFAEFVRKSLRNDNRVWVRSFSASMLLKAFEKQGVADYIFILSDPSLSVRGFGTLGARVYKVEDVACSLGAGVLSKDPAERSSTIRSIRELLRWKGLPYYSALLYDSNVDVASEAAQAFRSCNKEDAIPHLLRFLKDYGKTRTKTIVTTRVIETLCEMYGEQAPARVELKQAVDTWLKRLEKESIDTKSP